MFLSVSDLAHSSVMLLSRTCAVYRLHWLRARARYHRWQEEVKICGFEMEWVVRWFMHMASTWATYCDSPNAVGVGLREYANGVITYWDELGRVAERNFVAANPAFVTLWSEVGAAPAPAAVFGAGAIPGPGNG